MPSDPTGLEPTTPVHIKQVSVTERANFRKCRRRWFLADIHRLQSPGEAMFFLFGEVMHEALAAYHDPKLTDDRLAGQIRVERAEAARKAFQEHWDASIEQAREDLGFLWTYAEAEWAAHEKLGRAMLEGYFRADVMADTSIGKILETEKRYRAKVPGTNVWLTGKIDLLAEVPAGRGRTEERTWDHKNLSSKHSPAVLDVDDQLSGYAWLRREVTGKAPGSVAYNVLLKKLPVSEKTGKPTTSQLFVRDVTYRSDAQLDEFGRQLTREVKDMRRVALHPEEAYPNPTQFNCPSCPVNQLCWAMMQGEDVESLIVNGFVVGDERD